MSTAAIADEAIIVEPRERYLSQIFPAPPVICGRSLKPLSLGRYRLMARFKCAWCADEQRIATAGDLLIGVLICSMSVDEFEQFAAQSDFKKQIQLWGELNGFFKPSWKTILRRPLFFLCNLARIMNPALYDRLDADYIVGEMKKFQAYIDDDARVPDYWDETENSRVSAMHWSQSIEIVLCGQLNWGDQQINEKPLGKALWDYFAHMETQGLITLMTLEEIEEYHKQQDLSEEEIAKQKEALKKLLAFKNGQ